MKGSGKASANFLDTCLDYSLTSYLMQRAASGVNLADLTQANGRADVGRAPDGDTVVSCAR